jgi:enoyl-CoA hydratase/carnithine racemase
VFRRPDDGEPSIAAINGTRWAGAAWLAMACTIRIAADTARSSCPK